MSELYQLIYTSKAVAPFSEGDLQNLLKFARSNNTTVGISGMLLYDGESFLQVLEGPRDTIHLFYAESFKDKRHERVNIVWEGGIEKRDFGDWTMGYVGLSREQLATVDGLNDFYNDGYCYSDLNAGQAKAAITAFLYGYWPNASAGWITKRSHSDGCSRPGHI